MRKGIEAKMVSLKTVTKDYGSGSLVLRQVSISVREGEFLYVLGGTGAGKTTLLKLFSLSELPTSGAVFFNGNRVLSLDSKETRENRLKIGIVPQTPRLIGDLSLADNLLLSLTYSGFVLPTKPEMLIDSWLDKVGLKAKKKMKADLLSGGEAQRLALARALIRNPKLIIADEPTGNQDRDSTQTVMNLLSQAHSKGATVIIATHDREMVRRARRKSLVLKSGQLFIEEEACFL